MTFFVEGPDSQKLMPMVKLFGRHTVEKAHHLKSDHSVKDMGHYTNYSDVEKISYSGAAVKSYHDIDELPGSNPGLTASQIMNTSVETLKGSDSIDDARLFFKNKKFRHIPVVTNDNVIEGILSDRDLLHYLSGLNDDYTKQKLPVTSVAEVSQLMKTEVLSASADTDVRYIARLFFEQHIGAMPIVKDRKMIGIITRSDVLAAVMRNFILELWA